MSDKTPEDVMEGFMRVWSKHENARRVICSDCYFESSEGFEPSHSKSCPRVQESSA